MREKARVNVSVHFAGSSRSYSSRGFLREKFSPSSLCSNRTMESRSQRLHFDCSSVSVQFAETSSQPLPRPLLGPRHRRGWGTIGPIAVLRHANSTVATRRGSLTEETPGLRVVMAHRAAVMPRREAIDRHRGAMVHHDATPVPGVKAHPNATIEGAV